MFCYFTRLVASIKRVYTRSLNFISLFDKRVILVLVLVWTMISVLLYFEIIRPEFVLKSLFYFFFIFAVSGVTFLIYCFYTLFTFTLKTLVSTCFIITLILFYFFPLVMLAFSLLVSSLSLLVNYRMFFYRNMFLSSTVTKLFKFLTNHKLIDLFFNLHSFIFYKLNDSDFYIVLNIIFFLSFGYVFAARVYIFKASQLRLSDFSSFDYSLLLLFIFLCLFAWLFRLFISFSNLLVYNQLATNLQSHLLLITDGQEPHNSGGPMTPPDFKNNFPHSAVENKPVSFRGWFNFHRHNHNYNFNKPKFYYTGTLILGVCTLGLGCFATYIAYRSYIETIRMNDVMHETDKVMGQTNDQWKVDNGLMTKDAFIKKYPNEAVTTSPKVPPNTKTDMNSPLENFISCITLDHSFSTNPFSNLVNDSYCFSESLSILHESTSSAEPFDFLYISFDLPHFFSPEIHTNFIIIYVIYKLVVYIICDDTVSNDSSDVDL